jgi:hypothetical protein
MALVLVDSDGFTAPTVSEDELARITAELRRVSADASLGAYEDADELIAEMAELVALGEVDQHQAIGPTARPALLFYPRTGGLR